MLHPPLPRRPASDMPHGDNTWGSDHSTCTEQRITSTSDQALDKTSIANPGLLCIPKKYVVLYFPIKSTLPSGGGEKSRVTPY
jgi:hypothetical protein